MTLFKSCSRNFDASINMALVNGGFLHYTDMEKFLKKNLLLWNGRSDFEIISHKCSLSDPFQKVFANFLSSINMALVNGGFLPYTDMKKLQKKKRRKKWLWSSHKFRWAVQGHFGPPVYYHYYLFDWLSIIFFYVIDVSRDSTEGEKL